MKVGDLVKHRSPGREIGIITRIFPIIGVPGGMAKICWTGNLPPNRFRINDVLYRVENLEIINENR
jgi:hypothetical protein